MDSKWTRFPAGMERLPDSTARQFHWFIEDVAFIFTISIFVLGVAAFFGGLWLNKKGGPGRWQID